MRQTYFRRPVDIILAIEEDTKVRTIYKKLDTNFSYIQKILNKFEKWGFIRKELMGRENHIFLTPAGKQLVGKLRVLDTQLRELGD